MVVGAGPVGLSAALFLAEKRRLNQEFIDKVLKPTTLSKAVVVNSRTLELLESSGTSEKFVKNGWKLKEAISL